VLILIGYLVVLGTVFGGYMMTGGHLGGLGRVTQLKLNWNFCVHKTET